MMSAVPPAAKPTTMRTGLSNLSCSLALAPNPASSATSSAQMATPNLLCMVLLHSQPQPACHRIRSPSPGLTRDPPRQRTPLLPVLFGARARQIEHRQAVASAMHVYLRRTQVRDQRKLECVEKFVQLARAVGPRVDAHRHQADGDFTFLDRFVLADLIQEMLCRPHVESAGRYRQQQYVGAAHGVAQTLSVQAGGSIDHQPMRVVLLGFLPGLVRRPGGTCGKQRRTPRKPFGGRTQGIEIGEDDALLASREPAGEISRKRGLAAAALRICHQNGLHWNPPLGRNSRAKRVCRYKSGSTASRGSRTAPPNSTLRAPLQPVSGSGRLALSLNGNSRVSARQP